MVREEQAGKEVSKAQGGQCTARVAPSPSLWRAHTCGLDGDDGGVPASGVGVSLGLNLRCEVGAPEQAIPQRFDANEGIRAGTTQRLCPATLSKKKQLFTTRKAEGTGLEGVEENKV